MGIKAKLTLIGLLPLMMALVYGIALYLGQERLYKLREASQMADAIEGQIDLLKSTAFEYFESGGERPRQQARQAFVRAEELLGRAPKLFHGEAELDLISDLAARLKEAHWTFHEYDSLIGNELNSVQQVYLRDGVQRLNMELRSFEPLLDHLHRNAHRQTQGYSDRLLLIELGILALVALLALLLMLPVLFRIRSGLGALKQATQELGEGELRHQLSMDGSDEFSLLARDFNDMTRRLAKAEAARVRRSEELEVANQDLESFSYSVSHDLRAPLRAIDGFVAILLEEYAGRLDDEGVRLFGIVRDNANRMAQLIDDILALSRAGRLELQPLDLDMNRMVQEVWESLADRRANRDIEFRLSALPAARGDPRALRQIWQNLLENALKFSRDKTPAVIEVDAETDAQELRYRVRDNGAGFDPRYAHKLFGLFQRLHGMDEFDGTGVGLSIVQRLLRKHGGSIRGQGQPGAGASFEFTLPADPVAS